MICMWFGYGGNSILVKKLKPIIEKCGYQLITISEWEDADIKWNRQTWLQELKKADIIVLPANYKEQPAKSNNRLSQALSLGKPVICSPLDAYLKVLQKTPDCCLIADTDEEWEEKLNLLKDDKVRARLSNKALEAAQHYSIDKITRKWISEFNSLNKTDIVIPTYNNLPCLKLCLDSIRRCTFSLYNIIVVNNGTDQEVHRYLESQADIVYIKKDRLNFAQAINIGIKASSSKYVCLLNDDVIVSEHWLERMIEVCDDKTGAVGVLSNCDFGWQHEILIRINNVDGKSLCLLPGIHSVHEISPIVENIYTYKSEENVVLDRPWVAYYCTLIPRKVINEVGYLDEETFSNSGEDCDHCYRIKKAGYKIVQNFNAFVMHFGAVGRKILEKENPEEYQKTDKKNQICLNEKWNKKTVVLYSSLSWERWDHRSIETGIGGSELWQIYLAREFEKLGYRVISFCDCPEDKIRDGSIEYRHFSKFPEFVEYNWVDYFISSRTTDTFRLNIRAGKKFVMIHDIWILGGKEIPLYLDKVDRYLVLSEWHKKFASEYHGIPLEKMFITSNGVLLDRFEKKVERNPYRLHWSGSLDRGLDILLYLFDFIKNEIHELELHVFYGLDNWKKSAALKNSEVEINKIKEIEEGMKKPGVFYHGRVNQEVLAEEMLKASLWAYPTDFEETHCITAIEAQAAGVPVIATNYAGLQTTVGDSGILIGNGTKGQSYTREFRVEFVEKCIELLTNKQKWDYWSKKGLQNVKHRTWENVAKQFQKEIFCE